MPDGALTRHLADEHLENLSFLLFDRRAAFNHGLGLDDVAETEDRLEAHLDGLRFARGDALKLLKSSLGSIDQETVSGAAYALASIPDIDGGLEAALDAFLSAEDDRVGAYAFAFRYALHPELAARLSPLLGHERATIRAAVADVLAYRRQVDARRLWPLLRDPDPAVRGAAFAAMVRVGGAGELSPLEAVAFASAGGPSDAELLGLLRLGSTRALEFCRTCAAADSTRAGHLLGLALAGRAEDFDPLERNVARPALRAAAAEALGLHGHPRALPLLLEVLEDSEETVRVAAGQALDLLTAAGLIETVLVPEGPETVASTIDVEETAGSPAPEMIQVTRPSTDVNAWRGWWKANQRRFDDELRQRHGQPFSLGRCLVELSAPGRELVVRERRFWELQIRSGQRLPFEADALVARQRTDLAAWRDWWQTHAGCFPEGTWPFQGR